jgi:hypothetical protein
VLLGACETASVAASVIRRSRAAFAPQKHTHCFPTLFLIPFAHMSTRPPSLMLQRLALLRRARLDQDPSAALPSPVASLPLSWWHRPPPAASSAAQAPLASAHPHHHMHQARTFIAPSSSARKGGDPDGKIGADQDAVAALFDGALGPAAGLHDPRRRRVKDPDADRPKLLTARRESLALYREVLRVSNLFVWRDSRGSAWRDRLRASARAEFEAARGETDPEMVTRMIVTARDALHRAVDQFRERRAAIIEDEARRADAGVGVEAVGPPPTGAPPPPPPLSWGQGVPLVRGGGGGGGVGGGERR